MPAAFDLSVLGDKKLVRAFKDLSVIEQRRVVRTSMRAAYRPIHRDAKRRAPRGKTGQLRKGIKLRALKRSRRHVGVYIRTGTRQEMGIPAGYEWYYPAHVELGFTHKKSGTVVPPRPFMRPAFDANKNRAWRIFHVQLWRGIRAIWGKK